MKPRNETEREFKRLIDSNKVRRTLNKRESLTAFRLCREQDNYNSIYFSTYQTIGEWFLQKVFIATAYKKRNALRSYNLIWINGINAQGQRVNSGVGRFMRSYAYHSDITIKPLTFDCWHDSAFAYESKPTYFPKWINDSMRADAYKYVISETASHFDALWHFSNHSWVQTLVRLNQIELLKILLKELSPTYYNYICKKIDYTINPSIWTALKHYFRSDREYDSTIYYDYLKTALKVGKDIRNAHYALPTDLQKAHDSVHKKLKAIQREKARKEEIERAKRQEEKFNAIHNGLKGLVYVADNLIISSLDTPNEYIDEGEAMHHCVASYISSNSLIFSARDSHQNRLATIEISLLDYSIVQIRAICNKRPKRYDEIKELMASKIGAIKAMRTNVKLKTA